MVTKQEALRIIKSLAIQVEKDDPNYKREEFIPEDYEFFSIGVIEEEVIFRGEMISPTDKKCILGNCYQTGLAYSLAYETNNGEIELVGETFTNLNTGLNGGAVEALRKYNENFNSARDVPRFIVALKLVNVTDHDCFDDDTCDGCGEQYDDCNCDDIDEFDQKNIIDTFRPMNAFARARWLKIQGEI